VLLVYLIRGITEPLSVFFDIDFKGGRKRCCLHTTVGGLRRIVKPFRVSINAKGGDFWHVYRKNVLVIDGKKNNEPKIESVEDEKSQKR
jgi:hypothetical protein